MLGIGGDYLPVTVVSNTYSQEGNEEELHEGTTIYDYTYSFNIDGTLKYECYGRNNYFNYTYRYAIDDKNDAKAMRMDVSQKSKSSHKHNLFGRRHK